MESTFPTNTPSKQTPGVSVKPARLLPLPPIKQKPKSPSTQWRDWRQLSWQDREEEINRKEITVIAFIGLNWNCGPDDPVSDVNGD